MSTRGFIGFRLNNQDLGVYSPSDSYPSYAGKIVMEFIQSISSTDLKYLPMFIITGDGDSNDTDIGDGYLLLEAISDHVHGSYITINNYIDFLADSLFCEWAYILNIDSKMLEVYKGYNTNPHASGRYTHLHNSEIVNNEYYGVALVLELSFDRIRSLTADQIGLLCNHLELGTGVEAYLSSLPQHTAINVPTIQNRIQLLELR